MGLFTRHEKRKTFRGILRRIAPALAATAIIGVLGLWHPVAGAVGIAAAAAVAAVRQTRYDPTDTAGPTRAAVVGADLTLVTGAAAALLLAAKAGPDGVLAIPVVLAIIGVAAYRNLVHGSRVAVAVAAMGHAVRHHRRRTLAVWVTAVTAAVAGVAAGIPGAPLLAAGLALTPIRVHWQSARQEQVTRRAVERALAGVLTGGAEWTVVRAVAERAPIRRLTTTEDGLPDQIVLPVPPGATASQQASTEDEISARMAPWGEYAVRFEAGDARRATVFRVPPLPTHVVYDGRPATDRQVWVGVGKINREMIETRPSLTVGEQIDVTWDLATRPHGLVVGGTGSGKSIFIQLVLAQWLKAGHKAIILDPKVVGFTAWRRLPGVLSVATTPQEIGATISQVREEMMARYTMLAERGVDNVTDLPESDRPPFVLVVMDEATEAVTPERVAKDDEEGAAENAAKAATAAALSAIVRLGRAAGIHALVGTQRPDLSAAGLSGNTKANLEFRVLMGAADRTARGMAGFEGSAVAADPSVRGRGICGQVNTAPIETQVAYAPNSQINEWFPEEPPPGGDDGSRDGRSVVDRHNTAAAAAARYRVLAEALDAGELTDDDAHACGYASADAVARTVATWRAAVADQAEEDARVAADALAVARVNARKAQRQKPRQNDSPPAEEDAPVDQDNPRPTAGADGKPDRPRHGGKRVEPLPAGEAMTALHELIGLAETKAEIEALRSSVAMAIERADLGIGDGTVRLNHLVFGGAPGTGKTVVARIVGSLLRDLGALPSGHVIEADRAGLVAGYVGHTGPRTHDACDDAMGGVLFVDEAYNLAGRGDRDFGQEALEALMVRAENDRNKFVIILAGYTDEMERLLDANPGLRSRFPARIDFPSYGREDLAAIYEVMVAAQDRVLADDAKDAVRRVIDAQDLHSRDWGNARSVRNLVDQALRRQDARLAAMTRPRTAADHLTLTAADVLGSVDATEAPVDPVPGVGLGCPDGLPWDDAGVVIPGEVVARD